MKNKVVVKLVPENGVVMAVIDGNVRTLKDLFRDFAKELLQDTTEYFKYLESELCDKEVEAFCKYSYLIADKDTDFFCFSEMQVLYCMLEKQYKIQKFGSEFVKIVDEGLLLSNKLSDKTVSFKPIIEDFGYVIEKDGIAYAIINNRVVPVKEYYIKRSRVEMRNPEVFLNYIESDTYKSNVEKVLDTINIKGYKHRSVAENIVLDRSLRNMIDRERDLKY